MNFLKIVTIFCLYNEISWNLRIAVKFDWVNFSSTSSKVQVFWEGLDITWRRLAFSEYNNFESKSLDVIYLWTFPKSTWTSQIGNAKKKSFQLTKYFPESLEILVTLTWKKDPISAYNAGLFLCPIEQGEWLYFDITFYKPHTI